MGDDSSAAMPSRQEQPLPSENGRGSWCLGDAEERDRAARTDVWVDGVFVSEYAGSPTDGAGLAPVCKVSVLWNSEPCLGEEEN